jgi:hypothetical protein
MGSRRIRSTIVSLAAVACLLLANPLGARADELGHVYTGTSCPGISDTVTVRQNLWFSPTAPQFSNGETVTFAVEEVVSPPHAVLSVEMLDDTIVLPDDWEAGLMASGDVIEVEITIEPTAVGTTSGTIVFTNGLELSVTVLVEDCTPESPPSPSCDRLFPEIVHVGDTFDFGDPFLDPEEPEPFLVFRSDDGQEWSASGYLGPDQRYEFTIEITPDWIGHLTAELYSGEPGDEPCVDRFTVVGSATEEPRTPSPTEEPGTPAASDAGPAATPRLTLPASSTQATTRAGAASLATLLLVLAGAAVSVVALLPSRRRNRR